VLVLCYITTRRFRASTAALWFRSFAILLDAGVSFSLSIRHANRVQRLAGEKYPLDFMGRGAYSLAYSVTATMPEFRHDRFTRLFMESREALNRYVRRLVRSRESAEEIVQEAFTRTYEKGGSAPEPRAFLFLTARNLAADHRRKARHRSEQPIDGIDTLSIVAADSFQDERVITDEASQILKQAIERLPPQCHAALTLRVFHGYSAKEIGVTLGVSQKTVEKHVSKGLIRVHNYVRARYSGGSEDG